MEKFRYNSEEERIKRLNRFILLAANIVFGVLVAYHVMLMNTNAHMKSLIWNIGLMGLCAVCNYIYYNKNKTTLHLKTIISVEVAVQFLFYLLSTDATFLGLILIGILAVTIPYYEKKSYRMTFFAYTMVFVFGQICRQLMGVTTGNATGICQVIMTFAIMIVLLALSNICKVFSDDALGAIEEQKEEQAKIMESILQISKSVKENTNLGTEMVDKLWDSTVKTTESMNNITEAIEEASDNIESQSGMTQNIQSAINEAKERSEQIVKVAENSSQNIRSNQEMMEQLKNQARKITGANEQVNVAMEKLQKKTVEVVELTGMILRISNQTNLLALNASIESARAGEAGKGFAVVAEQIRQLSEETKKSTESITQIINELDLNAKEVMESVKLSAEAASGQNDAIVIAAESVEQLDNNIGALIGDIQEIDLKIEHLSQANNQIVDSITTLMQTTKEVTASAEQTNEDSRQNVKYVESAKTAIHEIKDDMSELQQYI